MIDKTQEDEATVERLERELAEARSFIDRAGYRRCDSAACNCGSWHGGHASQRLQEIADVLPWQNGSTVLDRVVETVADAEALRALAAWVNADKGWRKVSEICSGERFAFEVTIRFWRGNDGQQQVWGEADTLAAAIRDALWKAEKV
jgi:hypothetical protein